jgi:NADH dehydrogenase/NADH:ubiquinone oxidoreductase subunit G
MSNVTSDTTKKKVSVTIDGNKYELEDGINLIAAAKAVGIDVPHYCYHPHLSVAGNCRMCQVEVVGMPKLTVGCNTFIKDGMEFKTHLSSPAVVAAQAATLEFILINHPLDCTICDQAGHCKLQDYHYEYNARPSRFIEEKEKKVKNLPLGPTVMLDGERCIMCTRCVRFCDEVTGTSELGMLNRGDRSVIAVAEGRELDNPLSGSVVDLCPVGALTHREWRFNTRIWFTEQTDGICPGCSTGCNVRIAVRDEEVVQVKARLNDSVNKEWLCDEGRYGFSRFLPKHRFLTPRVYGEDTETLDALKKLINSLDLNKPTLFLLGGDQTLENYQAIKDFTSNFKNCTVALNYRERGLNRIEKILKSPDICANFRSAQVIDLVSGNLEKEYFDACQKIMAGQFEQLFLIGDRSLAYEGVDYSTYQNSPNLGFTGEAIDLDSLRAGIRSIKVSIGFFSDIEHPLINELNFALPLRSILEQSGMMINRSGRLQWTNSISKKNAGIFPIWRWLALVGKLFASKAPFNIGLAGGVAQNIEAESIESYLNELNFIDDRSFTIACIEKLDCLTLKPDVHPDLQKISLSYLKKSSGVIVDGVF